MGVLDDAIREHLDLKRARGGDPAEIERMEREALGPVRREPTIGSPGAGIAEQPAPRAFAEPGFDEEPLTELEELQEHGYIDSTAPHPHPHHGHVHPDDEHLEPHLDDAHLEHVEEVEPEQPKRRFLRRNRPASLSEPEVADPGFHELPPSEFHEEPDTEHHDLLDHPDSFAHGVPDAPASSPSGPPPHLQFDNPPKRPRFTAEPPALQDETPQEPEAPAEPVNTAPAPAAPAPAPPAQPAPEPERSPEPPAAGPDAQETTEFDVQKHMSEAPPEDDEDMLEETPDFLQDTPEHDRLWFEQRPPKDFDFNG